MKVKNDSLSISNKKKNALPSSKLLKPKKFKTSLKKANGATKTKPSFSKDKLKLITNESISPNQLKKGRPKPKSKAKQPIVITKSSNKQKVEITPSDPKQRATMLSSLKKQQSENKAKSQDIHFKGKKIASSFDYQSSAEQKKKENLRSVNKQLSLIPKGPVVRVDKVKPISKKQQVVKSPLQSSNDKDYTKEVMSEESDCKLKVNKVTNAAQSLLKLINKISSSKAELLDVAEPVFIQVECIKIPICPTKQLRFKLPHPLVDETSDILLITPDLKGHKIYPEKAVDHYEELLSQHQVNFVNKVMPLRMIRKEYSQYEMRKKLVNQFDMILADARVIKSLPALLGKFILYNRKMPIPVRLDINGKDLKRHLLEARSKTQMTVKSNGHTSVVQVGHSKMSAKEIATNIVEAGKKLAELYPGGWRNVRKIVIKTAKSTSLPVYFSLISPNEVRIPVEQQRRLAPIEGELSTMLGMKVVVTHDGNVILKKVEEDIPIDDSRDDEILEEAEKYIQSSKTIRHDESSDEDKQSEKEDEDSDNEADAVTAAMEKELLSKYEKNAKSKRNKVKDEEEESEEEDEEEEEENAEETEIIPIHGKKRKRQGGKKKEESPKKKQFKPEAKGKVKKEIAKKVSQKGASPGVKKPQTRGARGGKKNKMSKDQRKALIKRKKAGKK